MMKIRIRSRQPGFRRAGVTHEADRIWPADRFSADELALLKSEPLLVVTELDDDAEAEAPVEQVSIMIPAALEPIVRQMVLRAQLEALASGRSLAELVGPYLEDVSQPVLTQNTEGQPAPERVVEQAEPEPVLGAQTTDEAGASALIAASEILSSETGEAAGADPAVAPAAALPAAEAKPKGKAKSAKPAAG